MEGLLSIRCGDETVSLTPDIIRFTSPLRRTELLTAQQVGTLKEATLDLLADVGVLFPSRHAVEIIKDRGARVDEGTGLIRFPADLVERALADAPRSFVLGGRQERFDLLLDGQSTFVATEGVGVRVVDLETGEVRPSRKADVALMARVCDALPLVSFFCLP